MIGKDGVSDAASDREKSILLSAIGRVVGGIMEAYIDEAEWRFLASRT